MMKSKINVGDKVRVKLNARSLPVHLRGNTVTVLEINPEFVKVKEIWSEYHCDISDLTPNTDENGK